MTEDDLREMGDVLFSTFNAKDWTNLLAHFSPDAHFRIGSMVSFTGLENAEKVFEKFTCALDITLTRWSHIAEENRVATQATARVTYVQDIPGFPKARGQIVDQPFVAFLDEAGGVFSGVRVLFSPIDWRNAVA
ncbi:nuclear transport factor 2 family protein [Maritimibacter dapengensis]|uniref:Nuclear transport factor 2 family protein n=1 Tax=Maritimibacter dapengensis TaxID=2836868 RepID=A0ABS6T124_9RHOB|nr:nuclear transport factor 2 family protein [Maritimibacter dapengensis]MBV7378937.1 nuclear transport factor 2 family protein [Maritimibacter dapengensis]